MATEQWLEMTVVEEISLVPDASNPEADVVFIKAKTSDKPLDGRFAKLSAILSEAGARQGAAAGIAKIHTGYGALTDALTAIGGEAGLTTVHKSRIIAALGNFEAVLADLVPTGVVSKAVAETMMAITAGDDAENIAKEIAVDINEIKAALEKAESNLATATATITKSAGDIGKLTADNAKLQADLDIAKAALPGAKDEDIYKGLPVAVVTKMKAMESENAASAALIQKMADESGIGALSAVLKAALVPDFDTVAPALYRIEKGRPLAARKVADKDVAADIDIVKAAMVAKAKAIKAPLGTKGQDNVVAFGKGGGGEEGESAFSKLNVKAEEIRKAADGKITKEAAFSQAMDADPALYEEYRVEQRRRVAGL